MSEEVPYPSLVDFTATWSEGRSDDADVAWAHPAAVPLAFVEGAGLRPQLEDLLDTIVAVQRAEWVQDGIYLGPRSMSATYRHLLEAAKLLDIAVPPAVVSSAASNVYGTDNRAFLHLNSFFLNGASDGEKRFLVGRLCGHVAARQVTWETSRALLVDQGGLRAIARRALGPALEVFLAPLSFGARLALSQWHRAAEITADRAGLLCTKDLDAARLAMLRTHLGIRPDMKPEDYLDQLRGVHEDGSPARWAEILSNKPFTHKRMKALELFARSEVWVGLGNKAIGEPLLSKEELERQTSSLLQVA